MDTSATAEAIRLMKGIAEQGELHLRELEVDYSQLRALLSDSVDRIADSFVRVAALASPARVMGLQSDDTHEADEYAPQLEDTLNRIANHAAEVATDLQFHDLASQILARSEGRVHGMSALLAHLRKQAEGLSQRDCEPELGIDIATAARTIREGSQELAARLRKTVTQRSVEAGDIELF